MITVYRPQDAEGAVMECLVCGKQARFDDSLPYVNQTAAFATDHGCPAASRGEPHDNDDSG